MKEKTRYTPVEIETAYTTLTDDKKRRCYDNYLDYNKEELFTCKRWLKKKFFNWLWELQRWFSCCQSELSATDLLPSDTDLLPSATDPKIVFARWACLFLIVISIIIYVCLNMFVFEKIAGFKSSLTRALVVYAYTFVLYFSFKRIFNDNFKMKLWVIMLIVGGIFGTIVGLVYYFTLKYIRTTTSATWKHQAVTSVATGAVIGLGLSVLSDLSDIYLDKEDNSRTDVAKRAFSYTVAGALAGFVLGILADKILKLKANAVYDDIIVEGIRQNSLLAEVGFQQSDRVAVFKVADQEWVGVRVPVCGRRKPADVWCG